jgi:PAP2 superfamily
VHSQPETHHPRAETSRLIWSIIAAMAVAAAFSFWHAGLKLDPRATGLSLAGAIAMFLMLSWRYRGARLIPWLAYGTEGAAQVGMLVMLGALLSYSLGANSIAYRDAQLDAIDVAMGFDWRAYFTFTLSHPWFAAAGDIAYASMPCQFFIVLAALTAAQRFRRLQHYVLAIAIALIVTLSVFAFMPALGTYGYFHMLPGKLSDHAEYGLFSNLVQLEAVRANTGFSVRMDQLEGLIAFPSFHTVAAVLFMWALAPLRGLRWIAFALNIAMLLAIPIAGGHYLIDVIAGIGVAAMAIALAGQAMKAALDAPAPQLAGVAGV